MINERKIQDGHQFAKLWNQTFLATFNKHFATSKLNKELAALAISNEDPIEEAYTIGLAIDEFLIANHSKTGQYKRMLFIKSLVKKDI